MSSRLLLDVYLKQLRLKGFAQHYEALAREAESSNLGHVDYLAALCEQEVLLREQNQLQRRLKQAMFPWVTKTLDTFDFTAVPSLNKAKILSLARGDFVRERESCIIIGNPGTGNYAKLFVM